VAGLLHMFISWPFAQIWVIRRLESPSGAEDAAVGRIFTYYVMVVTSAGLALSLFGAEIVGVVASSEYARASLVVPVLCLAAVMGGLGTHLEIPIYRARRTELLMAVSVSCALVSVPAHYGLAFWLGILGTGVAVLLVGTVRVGLLVVVGRWRGVEPIGVEWRRCADVVGRGVACYAAGAAWLGSSSGVGAALGKIGLMAAFVVGLLLPPLMTREERRPLFRLLREPREMAREVSRSDRDRRAT